MSMIELQHLTKTFGSGETAVHALNDVSLSIEEGEVFGIIGLSGAGKSTLVRCINLLETPTSGRVIVDGKDMTALKGRELRDARRNIGMIFQGFDLLMQRDALGNVRFPLELAKVPKAEADKRARELLATVGLEGREHHLPNQLSGGQQQRVAIGRALMNAPAVVLADEPTGNLDSKNSAEIMALLRKSNRELKQTLVVITHDEEIALSADRVIALEDGRIASDTRAR